MTERRQDEKRRHPLLGACVVSISSSGGQVGFCGEVVDIVRTNARYGDAVLVEGFPRIDRLPTCHRLISVSDIAAVAAVLNFLLFDGPIEVRDYLKAHFPAAAAGYVFEQDTSE